MKLLRWLSALVVAVLLGQQLIAGGCASPSAVFRGTFKVGLIAPFSGQNSVIGYNMLFAAKLAIKEWNESDRLKGYRVELLAQDDRNDSALGLAQAKKMVLDRDVLGVVGHPSNASAGMAAQAYNAAGLTMITTEATADSLLDRQTQSVFRLAASESAVVSETAKFLASALKTQRVAVVSDPAQEQIKSSTRLSDALRRAGLSLTFGEPLKPEQADFTEVVRRISAGGPQAIFFQGEYLNAGGLLNKLRLQKISSAYLVNMGPTNPHFLKTAGNSAEGSYLVSLGPNPTEIPAAASFVQAYRAMSGTDPLPSAVLTYDATNLLLAAVERVVADGREVSRGGVLGSMRGGQEYVGLSSTIAFDETGRTLQPKVYFYRITGLRLPGERQVVVN